MNDQGETEMTTKPTTRQSQAPSCSHGYTVYAGKHPNGKPCDDEAASPRGICTEPNCSTETDLRCARCREPFCGDHLFVTTRDGNLCNVDYNDVDDRLPGTEASL